ncbi:MAG TPA: flagellar protein FlaG, partial [Noviherbaspirillum sp.]|nr:flagellar protein FlaG [Noviherbaspirillum sp.]
MDIQPVKANPPPMPPADRAAPAVANAPAEPAAPVQVANAVQQPAAIPSMAQVAQAIKNINKTLQEQAQGVEFSMDSDSHRTIIKIVDQKTKEVLRQIPSEEALE